VRREQPHSEGFEVRPLFDKTLLWLQSPPHPRPPRLFCLEEKGKKLVLRNEKLTDPRRLLLLLLLPRPVLRNEKLTDPTHERLFIF
jgi:hypothetical protein